MVQFNLLPQVKVDFIKTKQLKRTIIGISMIAVALSIALLLLTFSLKAVQNKHVSNLDQNIAGLTAELKAIPELTKILSVQNQLNTLPTLYAGRPAVDRLPAYLDQTTPTNVGISKLLVDFSLSTIEVAGSSDTLESVNRYVDTLKFTKFKAGEGTETTEAFTGVVLKSFGRDDKGASFTINLTFNPVIFDNTQAVVLETPSIVTTRSQVQSQTNLFDAAPAAGEN